MYTAPVIVLLLTALVEARFGQEQGNGAIQAISALGDLGKPGEAATIAGGSIGLLLAAANPCKKLEQADTIVATLGDSDRSIAAARGLAAAEINFNPSAVSIPSICADPALPKTESLRGVVPLIDPAVVGSDIENKNSALSVKTPFEANGLSQAQVMVAQGFSNFTAVNSDGTKVDAASLGAASSGDGKDDKKNSGSSSAASAASSGDDKDDNKNSGSSSAASSGDNKDDKKNSGSSSAASSNDDKDDKKNSGSSSAASSGDNKDDKKNSGSSSAASSNDDKDDKKNSGSSSAASSGDNKDDKKNSGSSSAASSNDDKDDKKNSGSSSVASAASSGDDKDDNKNSGSSSVASAASSGDDKDDKKNSGSSSAASSNDDKEDKKNSGSSSVASAASSGDNKDDKKNSGSSSAAGASAAGDKNDSSKAGTSNSGASSQDADKSPAVDDPKTGTFEGFKASSIDGLDFGKCVPTMKFEAGLNGRKETEMTFQAIDPLVNKGQQEALNPNIITNRIKDQLGNVCGANQAAKDAAVAAMAVVAGLGVRDASVADTWNTKLGFDGADINPDKSPKAGLVGHT